MNLPSWLLVPGHDLADGVVGLDKPGHAQRPGAEPGLCHVRIRECGLNQCRSEAPPPSRERRGRTEIIIEAASEVGPSLFFSLLIIAVSFLPVFSLQDQEGRTTQCV